MKKKDYVTLITAEELIILQQKFDDLPENFLNLRQSSFETWMFLTHGSWEVFDK